MATPNQIEYAAKTPKAPTGGTVRGLESNLLAMPRSHGVPLAEQLDDEQAERRKAGRQLARMLLDHPCEVEFDPEGGVTECHHPHHSRDAAVVAEMLEAVGLDDLPVGQPQPAEKRCTRCRVLQPVDQFIHAVSGAGCTIRFTNQCDTCREKYYRGGLTRAANADEAPPVGDAWMQRGACFGEDVNLFYPVGEQPTGPEVDKALRICGSCPVRAECLNYAIARPEKHGIWGGMTERRRVNEQRRRQRRLGTKVA